MIHLINAKKAVINLFDIVREAGNRIQSASISPHLTIGSIRAISFSLYQVLEDKSLGHVLALCEQLLNEREWAFGIIAYDWAYRIRNSYDTNTFSVFESWLMHYVSDWSDCDDFCTHAFGSLLSQNNNLFESVLKWTEHPKFSVRRAAAVVLIYPIKHQKYHGFNPFLISDLLRNDSHYLVLKGYGWMLKVFSQVEPKAVYEYLLINKPQMPKIAFRYAAEKFSSEQKYQLMKH
ncbi:MAG: DNA alkylation repair protein [Negativicutes bacterium]|nr:DNA alkylation repair protein [Negativicutes bacterium]